MFTFKTEGTVAKGARHKVPWKLMLAGAFVACAFGGIAVGIAWATPGSGVTPTLLAGPVPLDEIHIVSQSPTHGVQIKTRGQWTCRAIHYSIVPGGHTGWHSHPGPVFVMITAGTMTKYEATDLNNPAYYPAGTGFVEAGGDVHIAGNEGTSDLKFVAFHLVPLGEPVRIDEPAP